MCSSFQPGGDYENQIQKIKAAKVEMDDYNAKKKVYDEAKKKYDEELAKYNVAKQKYDQDLIEYNKAMEELKKHLNEEGYLPEAIDQPLVFKSEPNATVSISTKVYSQDELDALVRSWGFKPPGNWPYAYFDKLNKGLPGEVQHLVDGDLRTVFELGKTATVTYTNLQNSTLNGKKIAKVVFKYTVKKATALPGKVPVVIKKDPTATIWYTAFFGDTTIGVNVQFFDEDDKPMDLKGALFSFSSLNRGDFPKHFDYNKSYEKVENFDGRFIEINGSTIKNHNGSAYSDINNAYVEDGSRFPRDVWDTETSPYSWYGAIVGVGKGKSVNYDMGGVYKGNVWFAFNSKIRAKGIPEKPTEPIPPVAPEEPKKPKTKVSYHYDVFYVKSQVEKTVTNSNGQDINNSMVKTESVVNFELKVSDISKYHEKIKSLVFTDKLPEGYKLDLEGTKSKSPAYDVEYNEGTRVLKFIAKTSLLNEINNDLTKDTKVPSPKITGTVTKEGTKYENQFTFSINNEYDVESDPVRVFTPKKPVKEVFDNEDTQVNIDGQTVKAGQELVYKVTYTNTTGTEQNVVIKDKIPKYTTYVEGSADNGGVHENGEITWTKNNVADGTVIEVTFKVKVNDDVNGEIIKNKSKVFEGNNSYETNETTNPTSTKPKKDVFDSSAPQVSIDKQTVKAGQELLYKVTYKNTTGKEQKVVIKDKIPEYTTYVENSADNGGVYKDGVITWTKEKVAAGETFEVTFKVKVKDDVSGEVIKNKANVLEGNNKFETNETTNPTSTKPKKDVFDSQNDQVSIDGKEVKAGQELLYKVTYKNTTGKDQKVEIKDKIPEYTTYVDGSASDGGVYKDGEITWTKEKVAADETFEVTFKVKVDENVNGEVIKNKANVLEGNNNYETNETTNPTPKKPGKEIPRTGFGANTALYTALLGLSTVALGGFRIRYKKKNNK